MNQSNEGIILISLLNYEICINYIILFQNEILGVAAVGIGKFVIGKKVVRFVEDIKRAKGADKMERGAIKSNVEKKIRGWKEMNVGHEKSIRDFNNSEVEKRR